MKKKWLVLVVLMFLLVGCGKTATLPADKLVNVDMDLSAVAVEDMHGQPMTIGDVVKGQPHTLFVLWQTGCEPCRDEVPHINAQIEKLKDKGIRVVGIGAAETHEALQQAHDEWGMDYPTLAVTQEFAEAVGDTFNRTPTLFLCSEDGKVSGRAIVGTVGESDEEQVDLWWQWIKEELGE